MQAPLKYYVGINVKADRRQVFGVHGKPTVRSHGKHFSAVIGPFKNLRAALYVRDRGFNNPQIRCPADAEKLCRVRSGPAYQRTAKKLKRRVHHRRARRAAPRRRKNPPPPRSKLITAAMIKPGGGKFDSGLPEVRVRTADGKQHRLFTFRPGRVHVRAKDFVGLTIEEAIDLHAGRTRKTNPAKKKKCGGCRHRRKGRKGSK